MPELPNWFSCFCSFCLILHTVAWMIFYKCLSDFVPLPPCWKHDFCLYLGWRYKFVTWPAGLRETCLMSVSSLISPQLSPHLKTSIIYLLPPGLCTCYSLSLFQYQLKGEIPTPSKQGWDLVGCFHRAWPFPSFVIMHFIRWLSENASLAHQTYSCMRARLVHGLPSFPKHLAQCLVQSRCSVHFLSE